MKIFIKYQKAETNKCITNLIRKSGEDNANQAHFYYQKQPFADVLKNLTIFTGKHLCLSLFLNKVVDASFFLIKRPQHRCLPVNIENFLRTAFSIEHFWWLLLYYDIHGVSESASTPNQQ